MKEVWHQESQVSSLLPAPLGKREAKTALATTARERSFWSPSTSSAIHRNRNRAKCVRIGKKASTRSSDDGHDRQKPNRSRARNAPCLPVSDQGCNGRNLEPF